MHTIFRPEGIPSESDFLAPPSNRQRDNRHRPNYWIGVTYCNSNCRRKCRPHIVCRHDQLDQWNHNTRTGSPSALCRCSHAVTNIVLNVIPGCTVSSMTPRRVWSGGYRNFLSAIQFKHEAPNFDCHSRLRRIIVETHVIGKLEKFRPGRLDRGGTRGALIISTD